MYTILDIKMLLISFLQIFLKYYPCLVHFISQVNISAKFGFTINPEEVKWCYTFYFILARIHCSGQLVWPLTCSQELVTGSQDILINRHLMLSRHGKRFQEHNKCLPEHTKRLTSHNMRLSGQIHVSMLARHALY
jgi:hypothetical protein